MGQLGTWWIKVVRSLIPGWFHYSLFFIVVTYKRDRSPYDKEQIINLMTFQILGVLLGGRIDLPSSTEPKNFGQTP